MDGCKRLRSLPNLPSKVECVSVNNCTSLERLPGPKNIFRPDHFSLCFKCINCFKVADNIQSGFNNALGKLVFSKYICLCPSVLVFFLLNIILCIFQGQSGKLLARRLPSIILGSEIPSWLKEVKICKET